MAQLQSSLMPFLYPCLSNSTTKLAPRSFLKAGPRSCRYFLRLQSTATPRTANNAAFDHTSPDKQHGRLNPSPSDYGRSIFQDRCTVTVSAGAGGNGCVSFLRDKYIEEGPANGGDGGTGGNILIQAIAGPTSLHKLARRGILKAKRGQNGKGKSQGGQRGDDILIQVPVGTVVREIGRYDPVTEKERQFEQLVREVGPTEAASISSSKREQWVLYAGSRPTDFLAMNFPTLPPPKRPDIAALEPKAPVYLDFSVPMDRPILLAAGAVGGMGNPHFVSKSLGKPTFATKGEGGMKLELEFELKLLADVGLVGLPNVGKSTLLRSITNSRTRVGNWAFTTLSPNIGTVVLDDHSSRRPDYLTAPGAFPHTRFTIADIPGLVEGAHQDKGLGLGFLRHIERAGILAFVIDLSAGDAVQALKGLWRELDQYQLLRDREVNMDTESRISSVSPGAEDSDEPKVIEWTGEHNPSTFSLDSPDESPPPKHMDFHPVYSKPWFVVGTKADMEGTKENFQKLRNYLADVEKGVLDHPSSRKNAWRNRLFSIPTSAINAEGVNILPQRVVQLMDGRY